MTIVISQQNFNRKERMKTIEKYYKGSNDFVNAYEKKDLEKLTEIFQEATSIWYGEWLEQGKKDDGSCCGGKGLEVYYIAPRCRSAKPINIVKCNWVQGNISAYKSSGKALDFLKKNNIEATYNDGWLD
jgi:hypothetical protein